MFDNSEHPPPKVYYVQSRKLLEVAVQKQLHICDWILEKRSKSHIRSFEINGFKELKPA